MSLDCPRCDGVKLEEIEIDSVVLDRCPRCAGLWFDHQELGQLVGNRPGLKRLESTVPPVEDASQEMVCPRCSDVHLRGLMICSQGHKLFRCASCSGTWMDRGELRALEDVQLARHLREYTDRFCPDEE